RDLLEGVRAQQIRSRVVVPFARRTRKFQGFFTMARARGGGHGEKLVSDFRQRAYHDDGAFMRSLAPDGGHAVDGLRVLHRGAAELHDDHGDTWRGEIHQKIHHGDTETRRKTAFKMHVRTNDIWHSYARNVSGHALARQVSGHEFTRAVGGF